MTQINRRTLFISSTLTGIVIGVLLSSCFSLFTREETTGVGHTCPAPNIIPPIETTFPLIDGWTPPIADGNLRIGVTESMDEYYLFFKFEPLEFVMEEPEPPLIPMEPLN